MLMVYKLTEIKILRPRDLEVAVVYVLTRSNRMPSFRMIYSVFKLQVRKKKI